MKSVWVTFVKEGFHHWPDAEVILPRRGYLSNMHRHLFHIRVSIPVTEDDRQVEFHELRDYCESWWPVDGKLGRWSCEMIAELLGNHVLDRWPLDWVEVSVSEDNECGAIARVHVHDQ